MGKIPNLKKPFIKTLNIYPTKTLLYKHLNHPEKILLNYSQIGKFYYLWLLIFTLYHSKVQKNI